MVELVPIAIRMFLAVSVWVEPSLAVASTVPGPAIVALPRIVVAPASCSSLIRRASSG
jgi:hypothetical protein